jgi:DNA-binding transcriptional LysR family regulator
MTETQLAIFVEVADQRSFTVAALRLGISQSAVSHAIGMLEKELGVRLFRRSKMEISPTDIGTRLLLRAREVGGIFESIRQEAADARGMKTGTLRIGSFGPTASLRLLPPLLDKFKQHYPGVEVHIDEGEDSEVIQWLRDRRVDVGFVVLPEEQFETLHLVTDQMVALLPRNHPHAVKSSIALSDLCSDPFVLTEAGSAKIVMDLFDRHHLSPRIRFKSSQIVSTLAHIQRGEAVTILAQMALPAQLGEGVVALPLNPPLPRLVGLAYHNQRQISPVTQAFIKLAGKMDFPLSQLNR